MRLEQRKWSQDQGWMPEPPGALGGSAQLVLVFGSTAILKGRTCVEQVRDAYPNALITGCSTAGEICGTQVSDDTLVSTAIHFEHTRVRSGRIELGQVQDSFHAGECLAKLLDPEELIHVLVFSDGLSVNGSDLVRGLSKNLPEHVTVTGGLAGDGALFKETLVIWDSVPERNTIVVLGLYGSRLRVGFGSLGGWDPFGPERLITRSKGNLLFELDGRSALELYKKYLGEHAKGLPSTGLLFPLSLRAKAGETGVVRTILAVNEEEQSMTFAGDVPEGSYVQLMKANFDRLIDGAVGAAKTTFQAVGSNSPDLAVLISCVGRKLVLKQRVEEEVEGVRDILGNRTILTGFYSYGEISPFMPGAKCELHNQTMTIQHFPRNKDLVEAMHSLLKRQLKRYFGDLFPIPEDWQGFISAVSDAYGESDSDREMLERILDLSSQELIQANSEMRAIFQAIPDLMIRLDSEGTVLEYKAGSMADFFLQPKELIGKRIQDVPLMDIGNKFHNAIHQVQEKKVIVSIEYALMVQDQENFYEVRLLPLLEDQIIVIIRNITEHKKAEEAMRRSSELYRTIFENTGSASILVGKDTTILLANSNFEELSGYTKQEMEGKMSWTVFITDKDIEMMKRYHELRRKDPVLAPASYEFRFKNRTGELRDILLTISMIPGTSESVASCMDITERKRAEEELHRSEERYRSILDSMEEAYYEVNLEGVIVYFNSAAARMIGYSEKELLNRSFREIMDEENSKKVFESFHQAYLTGESTKVFNWEFITKDGKKLVVEASVYLNMDINGNPIGFKGIGRDITERKRSEEALRQSEAKYRFLTEKTNDVIWTSDQDLNITFVSSSIEKILGYTPEELTGQKISEKMTSHSSTSAQYLRRMELDRAQEDGIDPERTVKVDLEFYHKNGSTVWVENLMSAIRDDSGRFIGIHGVSRDITERKLSEEEKRNLEIQLAQAQKMESIGTLAGGIAHDFNNILSALIGYTELAINDVLEPEKAKSELMEVLKAGDRAKDLVSQILTFSHQTEKKHSPLALQTVIKESLKMLRSIIPSTIELRQDLMDSGLVMSDPTQINQVMMNLCINAAHAMDKTGGILEVGLKRIHLNGNTDIRDLNLVPGPYLRISVSDTGHGMTPEVMARIFDPYFTTKEVGRGTGLGLAVVHGIVKGHGGTITCKSALDEGTTFYVYLPEIESGKEISIHQERTPLPTGTERILYVDDEPVIVDLAKKMLENLGYTVFTRTSSIEALEFFRNNPDKFDLVITDMTMPGMTGDRLTQRMMEIRHDIPIILCTGYSEHITEERAKRIGIREFIMKPLIMKEIAKIIRRALDER